MPAFENLIVYVKQLVIALFYFHAFNTNLYLQLNDEWLYIHRLYKITELEFSIKKLVFVNLMFQQKSARSYKENLVIYSGLRSRTKY